ncbi:hypothetical protein Q1695_012937 [Nippostrongylus brasiliensis]|nr:hypothetical protein Q1695_012937 [Nippostrongylus brasiliensis]
MVVREDDEIDLEDATRHASILQSKQLITNNVINKRKEQLQRWETSEMNAETAQRRKNTRVKFQDSDVFLSACMSGDEEEVEELLANGADINTATVDGLTALHQSVIDSKPDMVRFLCEKGADVNAQDNEGWTPLHAAACCGNLAIVKYLCQNGAQLNVINSDKELALDLADDESCREYLEHDYRVQGVIPEQCRDQELAIMMKDAQQWLRDGEYRDQPHRRTGATALHVAAAKGYTQLLELLIKAGGNIKAADKDGWTPLHAAAHWAEKDSCKILMEHGASITDTNFAGQNVLAVADKDVVEYLEDLERSVDKRKSPPSAPAGILQEKNNRLSHEEHVLSTEHKRELKHKDQTSENEVLHSSVKLRKIEDRSPPSTASDSSSPQDVSGSETQSSSPTVPAVEEKISSVERSASEPPTLPRTNQEPIGDRLPSATRSTVSADRSVSSVRSYTSNRSVNAPAPIAESGKLSDSSSSSIHSGDQHVSATVSIPTRPLQQPNSWINRGVQLIARSGSSTASNRSSTAGSTESSSPISMSLATSSGSSVPFSPASPSVLSKPPPWQSSAVIESEAERRNTARMQRQHRRSTQGVTKEHLEEASRIAMAENARRRGSTNTQNAATTPTVTSGSTPKETGLVRLASEERDLTSMYSDRSSTSNERGSQDGSIGSRANSAQREFSNMSDRTSSEHSQLISTASTTATTPTVPLSLSSSTTSASQAAVGMRRKSQGLSVSRSNRRGTGPVLPEDIHAAVTTTRHTTTDNGSSNTSTTKATSGEHAPVTSVRVAANVASVFSRPPLSSVTGRSDVTRGSADSNSSASAVTQSQPVTATRTVPQPIAVGRVQPRLPGQAAGSNSYTSTTYTLNSRPTEMNLNYKALYEKEKLECERLRKEVDELKRAHENNGSVSSIRTTPSRFRIGSPAGGVVPIAKSASGNSLDDGERRTLERKIADLEIQLKGLSQLRMENQRLKEENGALVRVISKMTI